MLATFVVVSAPVNARPRWRQKIRRIHWLAPLGKGAAARKGEEHGGKRSSGGEEQALGEQQFSGLCNTLPGADERGAVMHALGAGGSTWA